MSADKHGFTASVRTLAGRLSSVGTGIVRFVLGWLVRHGGLIIAEAAALFVTVILRDLTLIHSPDFLATIVGFETTAVAITVPISLDVAFRVYDTYSSREVRRYLLADPRLGELIVVTVANVILALVAHTLFALRPNFMLFIPLSILAALNTVVVAGLLIVYLYRLQRRIVNEPIWLLERLRDEALAEIDLLSASSRQ